MTGDQKDQYQALVNEWRERARKYGVGIEEDTMEGAIEYPIRVTMHKYTKRGLFVVPDPEAPYCFYFSNPQATIGVVLERAKAHINRLTRCVEETLHDLLLSVLTDPHPTSNSLQPVDVWAYLDDALRHFTTHHPGSSHDITLESVTTNVIESYATRIQQTQELQLACGISRHAPDPPQYYLMFRTPVHTVCPFILHETDGQSHTQRAYLQIEFWSETPPCLYPTLDQINTRLQPCQSSMRIPDEAVQVLRAYCTATYTEDAVLRMLKVIRGIKSQIVPGGGRLKTRVYVHSIESIFQNDMTSEGSDVID